jgi:hypothetical protein
VYCQYKTGNKNCNYPGNLIVSKSLNLNESWRNLNGVVSSRMRYQELILRFFVLFYWEDKYTKLNEGFSMVYYHNKELENKMKRTIRFV